MAQRARKKPDKSFIFRDVVTVVKTTGLKASTLDELREGIAAVSEESIFHHTYQYFAKGHVQEYTNDFAQWAAESLEERALAEYLANIDSFSFKSTDALRKELLRVVDDYREKFPAPRPVLPGAEFYFSEAVSFVFAAGVRAKNLAEFLTAIKFIDASSIYYHYYEARVRLRKEQDDFSKWIAEVVKNQALADCVRSIDPFMHNLEGVRTHLAEMLEDGLRKEMEIIE
jgi:hypothetical protein